MKVKIFEIHFCFRSHFPFNFSSFVFSRLLAWDWSKEARHSFELRSSGPDNLFFIFILGKCFDQTSINNFMSTYTHTYTQIVERWKMKRNMSGFCDNKVIRFIYLLINRMVGYLGRKKHKFRKNYKQTLMCQNIILEGR